MGSENAMDIPETSKQPMTEGFYPKNLYTCEGTDNHALKSLLTTPSSPVYKVATADTTTLDTEFTVGGENNALPTLHEITSSDDANNSESQLLSNNVQQQQQSTSDTEMPDLLESYSAKVPDGNSCEEQEGSQNSQAMLDKLLGLKTLFKDPTNTTEFKTDYLKGFNTEKQDCDSLLSLFSSIQHPADALDIALARADDENLNRLIDQTIEAFDKQNFLTRGFLAKMPDYQHKFLVRVKEILDS